MRIPLMLAALACGCGAPQSEGRQTTVATARSDDPWLAGARCAADTPAEPAPRVEVLATGSGEPVHIGETVRVHYAASLPQGTKLHDTHDDGTPSEIILGSTKTICGFERALDGMRPGEQRRVTVPWVLAFGEAGRSPDVPPRSDLVFVIDLYLPADVVIEHRSRPVNPAGGGRRR